MKVSHTDPMFDLEHRSRALTPRTPKALKMMPPTSVTATSSDELAVDKFRDAVGTI
jgi:hypothetical protein